MNKYKATAVDGKVIFGDSIRREILGDWTVHENGETMVKPDTIEELNEGEEPQERKES